jgi:hypothetical protein
MRTKEKNCFEQLRRKGAKGFSALCLCVFVVSIFPACAATPTAFEYYSVDLTGAVLTNAITIKGWAGTNEIVGLSTNVIAAGFSKTYSPNTNGYVSGNIMPGNYKLTISGLDRSVAFGIAYSTNVQNIAQLAGFPVVTFQNFTLAQFSDAGTLGYTNADEFLPLVTNIAETLAASYSGSVSNYHETNVAANIPGYGRQIGTNTWTGSNTFEGVVTLTNANSVLVGSGAAITALDAGNVASGTLPDARLSNNIPRLETTNTFTGDNIFSGTVTVTSGGIWSNGVFHTPTMTNGQNWGNPFSSPGIGNYSEQFGANAQATNTYSTAFGNSALAWGNASSAFGYSAEATGPRSTAIGNDAVATSESTVSVGFSSFAIASNSTALGASAQVAGKNSTAVGYGAQAVADNQVVIGSGTISTRITGQFGVGYGATFGQGITNLILTGTNSLPAGSDISFGRYANTSLANSNNAAVLIGTNVFVQVSGPTDSFNLCGLDGAPNRDGKLAIILNLTGYNMHIEHESGVEPTAANRIISLTGASRVSDGNCSATFIYSGASSRWILLSFEP